MTQSFTVALAQMNAGRELKENLRQAEDLIRQAKDRGAHLVVTPENTSFIETERALTLEKALPADVFIAAAAWGAWKVLVPPFWKGKSE